MGAFSVNRYDFRQALRFPTAGWPALESLYETDCPGPNLERKIFDDARLQSSRPNHTFTPELGADPPSVASDFVGAKTSP